MKPGFVMKLLCPALTGIFVTCSALASMTIYPMAVNVSASGEGKTAVISKSRDVQFVKTDVSEIIHPATPLEKEVPVEMDANALVVTPPKFILPAGSSKRVRFIALNDSDTEKTYRVRFEAVSGEQDQSVTMTSNAENSHLSVNLIWGVLVSVPPKNPRFGLERSADGHSLVNTGNFRIRINTIQQCQKGQKESTCPMTQVNKNIYPGSQYPLAASMGTVRVSYTNWLTSETSSVSFNGR
ncbi:fimbria/pilus periplasmic chaperone [Enterobacter cloacae]|uniref:fimbrial protein n=1 Tax=Enterobacter cloacae TaxID=550 RepID=UPI0034A534FC